MPGTRAREEEGVGVLAEPSVAPSRDSVEGADEGGFGGWACKVVKIVGGAASRAEGSIQGGCEEADESNFIVGVANKYGLRASAEMNQSKGVRGGTCTEREC